MSLSHLYATLRSLTSKHLQVGTNLHDGCMYDGYTWPWPLGGELQVKLGVLDGL